jgi:organic hydroperoxide reductase OsmC/OhrA
LFCPESAFTPRCRTGSDWPRPVLADLDQGLLAARDEPTPARTIGEVSVMHSYELSLEWTGNKGSGTSSYRAYARDHEIHAGNKMIAGSSDPAFRGDARRWSPEELLVASLSQCHMLWFLHLASDAGLVVTAYRDTPFGEMCEGPDGGGQFTRVILRPSVTIPDASMSAVAIGLHDRAAKLCFIARSVNFPVLHEPAIVT